MPIKSRSVIRFCSSNRSTKEKTADRRIFRSSYIHSELPPYGRHSTHQWSGPEVWSKPRVDSLLAELAPLPTLTHREDPAGSYAWTKTISAKLIAWTISCQWKSFASADLHHPTASFPVPFVEKSQPLARPLCIS